MEAKIIVHRSHNKFYYYYQKSYRVKNDPKDKKCKQSGKAKVKTDSVFLGTADAILEKCQNFDKPKKSLVFNYGLPLALYSVAQEIGLISIINSVCPEKIKNISIGEYIFIAAANRVGHHHSKESIKNWLKKTKLPEIMRIDCSDLSSKTFWKAFNTIIPQKVIEEKMDEFSQRLKNRMSYKEKEEYLSEKLISQIEYKLYHQLIKQYNITSDTLIYDTTNFYHNISSTNERCIIPQTAKSKDGKNSNRLTGFLLAVDREFGFPLVYSIYQANQHDCSLFPDAINEITRRMSKIVKNLEGYTIVFDKGNNSKKNIESITSNGLIKSFVGSLCFSMMKSIANIPIKQYMNEYNKWRYMELEKEVFDKKAKIVVCYSEKEKEHQLNSFNKKIKEIASKLHTLIGSIKKPSEEKIKTKIDEFLQKNKIKSSRAKRYITYVIEKNNNEFTVKFQKSTEAYKKQKTFGKQILFTYDFEIPSEQIIQLYHDKYKIETAFRDLKKGDIVNYTPMYHWTDSKIRVQSFVNIIAYLLIKIIEMKIRKTGDHLSLLSAMEILDDIKEVVMVYSKNKYVKKVSYPSGFHSKIAQTLDLEKYEK